MWLIFALLGTVFWGLASAYMWNNAKDKKFDNREDLVLQYKVEIIVALIVLVGFTVITSQSLFPVMTWQTWLILAIIWLVWFWWIFFLYKWFEKLNPAIVLIIAQLNIFIMYFANVKFFDSSEQLSLIKIIVAVIFFLVVSQFLLPWKTLSEEEKKKKFCLKSLVPDMHKLKIDKYALYPILTAISRAIFTFAFIYLNKTWTFNPSQSVLFTEWAVWVFAILALLLTRWKIKSFHNKLKTIKIKQLSPYILLWLFQIIWIVFFAYAYVKASANMVNVIRLFQIILTWVFARIIFKQKMTKRNIALMFIAFIILLVFVLV